MKRAMRVENSVVVEEVETLPTGVKVITINPVSYTHLTLPTSG